MNDDEEFGPTPEVALGLEAEPGGEHVCRPTGGTDARGAWFSKHSNGFRAPEVVQDMECGDPTLVHERKRAEDFG